MAVARATCCKSRLGWVRRDGGEATASRMNRNRSRECTGNRNEPTRTAASLPLPKPRGSNTQTHTETRACTRKHADTMFNDMLRSAHSHCALSLRSTRAVPHTRTAPERIEMWGYPALDFSCLLHTLGFYRGLASSFRVLGLPCYCHVLGICGVRLFSVRVQATPTSQGGKT